MKNKKPNKSVVFFVLYLLNISLVRLLFFNSADYEEIYTCSIFVGLLVSFYFMFNFNPRILCLVFPIYYFICCIFCVALIQSWILFISKSSIVFNVICKSLIHNIILSFILLFPFIIISFFEKVILFKILDNVIKTFKNKVENGYSEQTERNPRILNPRWENTDGEPITKALVGDEVTLCADVTDIPDGTGAKIKIVEKDADGNDDDVATLTAKVSGGRIECAWKVVYTEDDDDADSEQEKAEKGYTLPEYAFTVECGSATSEGSGQLDVYADFIAKMTFQGKVMKGYPYILKLLDGTYKTGKTDEDGYIIESELPIGKIQIM